MLFDVRYLLRVQDDKERFKKDFELERKSIMVFDCAQMTAHTHQHARWGRQKWLEIPDEWVSDFGSFEDASYSAGIFPASVMLYPHDGIYRQMVSQLGNTSDLSVKEHRNVTRHFVASSGIAEHFCRYLGIPEVLFSDMDNSKEMFLFRIREGKVCYYMVTPHDI